MSARKGVGVDPAGSKRATGPSVRKSKKRNSQSSILKSVFDANKESVPLIASASAAGSLVHWASKRAEKLAGYDLKPPGSEAQDKAEKVPKVRTLALLSFATTEERWWMIFGLVMACISGLTMPCWLLLLAQSLETFNSIGKLVNTVGGEEAIEILIDELYKLCWSFAVVGGVSLVSGSSYVAIWTWTGESQSLRYEFCCFPDFEFLKRYFVFP